jgi:Peptidase family S41
MKHTIIAAAFCAALTGTAGAERLYAPREIKEDFAAMYQGLRSAHIDLYAFTPKAELDAAYAGELAAFDAPLDEFQVKDRFEQFLSHVHMGHTRIDFPYEFWAKFKKDGGKVFPLTIRVVEGRVYVAQNASGLARIAPGDEIVALNGQPAADWLARTERHVSAETPYMAHSLMEYDFAIYLWVELGPVEGFDLDIRRDGGALARLRLPARTAAEMKSFAASGPAALNLEEPLRESRMLDGGVGYLRPGPFYNAQAKTGAEAWDNAAFIAVLDDAFRKFDAAHAKSVIVDLRGNPGGDNLFSDPMIAWFATRPFRFFSQFKVKVSPQSTAANRARIAHDAAAAGPVSQQYARLYARAKNGALVDFAMPFAQPRKGGRFAGKVFVLIDRQSYSNSVAVAATVQDYRFATVIGEQTSDMATTYGALEQFTLPNTHIAVGYPKARIVRPNGDPAARGVVPDIAIAVPVVQTPADEVLRQAAAIASR